MEGTKKPITAKPEPINPNTASGRGDQPVVIAGDRQEESHGAVETHPRKDDPERERRTQNPTAGCECRPPSRPGRGEAGLGIGRTF